jgi:hypothetical protein
MLKFKSKTLGWVVTPNCRRRITPAYTRKFQGPYGTPRYFEGIPRLKTNQRQTRSSGLVQYSVKRTRRGFWDRSFSPCAPLLWNSLPQRLKQSQNVDIFKRRLKMWLFNDHFGGVALWSVFGKALYKCIPVFISYEALTTNLLFDPIHHIVHWLPVTEDLGVVAKLRGRRKYMAQELSVPGDARWRHRNCWYTRPSITLLRHAATPSCLTCQQTCNTVA